MQESEWVDISSLVQCHVAADEEPPFLFVYCVNKNQQTDTSVLCAAESQSKRRTSGFDWFNYTVVAVSFKKLEMEVSYRRIELRRRTVTSWLTVFVDQLHLSQTWFSGRWHQVKLWFQTQLTNLCPLIAIHHWSIDVGDRNIRYVSNKNKVKLWVVSFETQFKSSAKFLLALSLFTGNCTFEMIKFQRSDVHRLKLMLVLEERLVDTLFDWILTQENKVDEIWLYSRKSSFLFLEFLIEPLQLKFCAIWPSAIKTFLEEALA